MAAPFAVVGSIGVVAQLPNINRLLKKHDIDVELHTAGEYKRTLTVIGENTEEGRKKFKEELEDTHELFKEFVHESRPSSLDVAKVATGEHWYGQRALALGLVDELKTSDEYLTERAKEADVYVVRYVQKHKLMNRLGLGRGRQR
jgi:serine protease SohB